MTSHPNMVPLLRVSKAHNVLVPLCCILLLVSCGENSETRSERTKLELAEMKGDLDGMFLSLRKLAELGDNAAADRLPQVKQAVTAREQMLQAVADHSHEKAIHAAVELLDVIPEHKGGLRALRESGQIFYYLREAKRLLTAALNEPEPHEFTVEPISVDPSLPESTRGIFITERIQTLLADLGYYYGEVDGMAGSKTSDALKSFQKAQGKDGVPELSVETANKLQRAAGEKEAQEKRLEKKFYAFARARELVTSAKALDPHFPDAVALDQSLEHAYMSLIYMQALEIVTLGKSIVAGSASFHDTISSGLGDAAASRYGSVQDSWRRMSPFVDHFRRINKYQEEEMDSRLAYVSTYKAGREQEFVSVLKEYVTTVHVAAKALLEPTGSLIDFRRAASDAVGEYSRMDTKLVGATPSSTQMQENFGGLLKVLKDYTIFTNPQTGEIIDQHKELYSL